MLSTIFPILAPILVFGLVIFVHELGHFIAAKALGVYAPRFSIGFGPAIFRKRRGETEYILAWLPLGGYVRMASRHDAEAAFLEGGNEESTARREDDPGYDPNAMIPFGPKPVPENRWFESKPLWARVVILTAGVIMNAVLAVVVATTLVMRAGQADYDSTVIGGVERDSAVTELSQLRAGDTVRAVNGKPVASWRALIEGMLDSKDQIQLTTNRGTVTVPLRDDGPDAREIASLIDPYLPPVIDTVFPGDRALQGGLRKGDSVVSVGGAPVVSWTDMVDKVGASPEQPLTFVVRRGGATESLTVTPKAVPSENMSGAPITVGRIGAGAKNTSHRVAVSLPYAIRLGLRETKSDAGQVFRVLRRIGTGKQSVKELGGPIAITRVAVSQARKGLDDLFALIALLSINVAVLNLLPIPILDGGQILINVLESAKGSPFSMRTREYILRFGLFAIALLFAIVMYNDTRAGFAKLFGWIGKLFGA
jgi:regulator of sigma E protease